MKRITAIILMLLILSSCSAGNSSPQRPPQQAPEQEETDTAPQEQSSLQPGTTEQTQAEEPVPIQQPAEPTTIIPANQSEIEEAFQDAIMALQECVVLDVSRMTWQWDAATDLRNAYYAVLSSHPELKYAWDIQTELSGNEAVCTFSYMPYRTGAYDTGIPEGSFEISCLHDVYRAVENLTDGTQSRAIAITNPSLEVDEIQRALMHGGYGYLVYSLNQDATEILVSPSVETDLPACVAAIEETFRLAKENLQQILTPEMTQRQQVAAIYDFLTGSVEYDWRYYQDRDSMPMTSTTAMGALRDHLAICGGYSWAMKTMLDVCGIENYTVSGTLQGEYHAWNYVVLDGKGYYCDPTSDRGGGTYCFLLSRDELEQLGKYEWNDSGKYDWDADFYESICSESPA